MTTLIAAAVLIAVAVNDFVLCLRKDGEPLLFGQVLWVGEYTILVNAIEGRQVAERDHVLCAGTVAELSAFQHRRFAEMAEA